jgi:ABC-type Fe3+-siderophore transport system permease subunit
MMMLEGVAEFIKIASGLGFGFAFASWLTQLPVTEIQMIACVGIAMVFGLIPVLLKRKVTVQ